MPASIEKTYSEALFTLIQEEHGEKSEKLTEVFEELKAINTVLEDSPEFVKIMNTPTVSHEEKAAIVKSAFEGRTSEVTYNFVRVLMEKRRIGYFGKIFKEYKASYNELFGIAEVSVITTNPLTADLRVKIQSRMEKVTGKKVVLSEKTDKTLLGGIVIDYGSTRLDGSVKTRLDALKKEISNIIA